MITRNHLIVILFCSFLSLSASTWKVLVYMDSSDNLSDMAIKNITDMIHAKPNDNIEFLVQLHAYDLTTLRYRIHNNDLIFIEEIVLKGNSKSDFIDGVQWAFANNNADHTMLIVWDHGWGILDPEWNPVAEKWELKTDSLSNACMINRSGKKASELHINHKGFISNSISRTYLSNQDLVDSLRFIKETVLEKKIDILAFDTCMGAMLEIAYEVEPYAHFLVGSQSCSLRDGFNYLGIINVLNQGAQPRDIAAGMVNAFETYYSTHDESGIYTHAALDLSHANTIKEMLDLIIIQLLKMPEYIPFIAQARSMCPRLCLFPMYTDLIAFCKNIDKQLDSQPSTAHKASIQQTLQNLYNVTQNFVTAHCAGHKMHKQAHGFSIYLPFGVAESSYYATPFGHDSQWSKLLQLMN